MTATTTRKTAIFLGLVWTTIFLVSSAGYGGDDDRSVFLPFLLLLRNPHARILEWQGTQTCLQCHQQEAQEVFGSVHYQWLGDAPFMLNRPDLRQGKFKVGLNSYCINILGNWQGCGNCHAGLGLEPEVTQSPEQLANIDCLVCHQEKYKRKKIDGLFVPDTDNMEITMLEAARTVHLPRRTNCLQCHALAGGGDNFKRGDLALAHGRTTDRNFDVHMAVSAGNLNCQACHTTRQHRMAGKGSDLRPTDLNVAMACAQCHSVQAGLFGHILPITGSHLARVACQTCHIREFARNAADSAATEQTEMHRDWTSPRLNPNTGRFEPEITLQGNVAPQYRWWNGFSTNHLLFDQAVVNPETGRIPTSLPQGAVNDAAPVVQIFPFKYKTSLQPLATDQNELIALDTSVYFATGIADDATRQGLVNMGHALADPFAYVETETYQLLTHEVPPAAQALDCEECHTSILRMDLQGDLGYQLKGPIENVPGSLCIQCHVWRALYPDLLPMNRFLTIHRIHVTFEKKDCSWCHGFSRPERGLTPP